MDDLERLNENARTCTIAPHRPRGPGRFGLKIGTNLVILVLAAAGCDERTRDAAPDAGGSEAGVEVDAGEPAEDADAGDGGPGAEVPPPPERRCPADMVRVAKRFCVDRFEAVLLDVATGQALSAYYPPSKKLALLVERTWEKERLTMGDPEDQAVPLPVLPSWQKTSEFEPRAVSKKGVVPNGYTTGKHAALACQNAGKRLCSLDEWRTACRGEKGLQFPYGDKYVQGKCNVFREGHPAMELHDDASKGHADPRLNKVTVNGKPLLRKTGETPACASAWEDDAIHDMVGNLDEWIDDPEGTFVGGFFSRSTKNGCEATITGHPFHYFDYSTGTRCCADLPER